MFIFGGDYILNNQKQWPVEHFCVRLNAFLFSLPPPPLLL